MTKKPVVIQIHDKYKDKTLEWFEYPYIGPNNPMVAPGEGFPCYKGKLFTGTIEWFDEEGIIETRERLKEGYEHGQQETYYNGQLSEIINFKNGEVHGVCEYFDKDGNLDMKMIYKNDELIKTQSWEEGNLIYTWENESND